MKWYELIKSLMVLQGVGLEANMGSDDISITFYVLQVQSIKI